MRLDRRSRTAVGLLLTGTTIAGLIASWELTTRASSLSSTAFPPPSQVLQALISWGASGALAHDLVASLTRITIGFAAAAIAGVVLGLLTSRLWIARYMLLPILQAFRPIPPIAFVTLAILWWGIGEGSKYFLVFWGAVFPIWLSTHLGASRVPTAYLWAARSLGARGWSLFTKVIVPAALPAIAAGLRTGLGIAFVALIAAELAGAFEGLGFRISLSSAYFRSDTMLASLIVLGVVGAVLDAVFNLAIRRLSSLYGMRDQTQ